MCFLNNSSISYLSCSRGMAPYLGNQVSTWTPSIGRAIWKCMEDLLFRTIFPRGLCISIQPDSVIESKISTVEIKIQLKDTELSLNFHSRLKYNHIDRICMVFPLCEFGYVTSVLFVFGISFGSIRTQHVANRRLYRDVCADVRVKFAFF